MTEPARAGVRCAACLLRADCLCEAVPRIENRTEIVVVRHYAEEGRASNSGRLAAQALARCRLVPYGARDAALPPDALGGDDTWLLFPEPSAPPVRPPARVVVLDASWSQARRMRQRIPALRGMPVLAIAPRPAAERVRTLRTPPHPGQLPTILAIAEALAALEGEDVAAPLRALWTLAVDRMTADRRHPARWIQP